MGEIIVRLLTADAGDDRFVLSVLCRWPIGFVEIGAGKSVVGSHEVWRGHWRRAPISSPNATPSVEACLLRRPRRWSRVRLWRSEWSQCRSRRCPVRVAEQSEG